MNNEAKVRRSTSSFVLGKGQGKVMSFAEIEEARAARTVKDAIKGKGKRSRKRKSAAIEADEPELDEPEADEPEPEPEVARATKEVINGRGKRGRKRKITAQEAEEPEPEVARTINAPVPWKAPVADDMRLLHERIENRFSFPLVRIWFLEAGNRIQLIFVAFSA
jgi:hypothetical protein